ncbi:MAG: hypothetical protein Q4D79_08025 [Propionibacteriaceae bacterium]|nr:hypothetical protein [Propionibacteriaceae bacterium]
MAPRSGAVVDSRPGRFHLRRNYRQLDLVDADGFRLAHLSDPKNLGLDVIKILDNNENLLATMRNWPFAHKRQVVIKPVVGPSFILRGNYLGHDYTIADRETGRLVAQTQRQGAGRLRLRYRYALTFLAALAWHQRLAILGGVLALDMMTRKPRRVLDWLPD